MALKAVLDSLDGLSDDIKSLYVQKDDGKFHLDVEGGEDISGLKANYQKLLDEKKKLQDRYKAYDDIDPAKAKEALDKLRKIEEKELLDAGEVDKVVEKRVELMRQDHQSQIQKMTEAQDALTQENAKLKSRLSEAVIERGILDAVNAVGQPRKEALEDIVARGVKTWKLDDQGKPIPLKADGTTIYGKDGKLPMTMQEWAESLLESAPHLWLPSSGGGARGGLNRGNKGGDLSREEVAKLTPIEKAKLARGQLHRS